MRAIGTGPNSAVDIETKLVDSVPLNGPSLDAESIVIFFFFWVHLCELKKPKLYVRIICYFVMFLETILVSRIILSQKKKKAFLLRIYFLKAQLTMFFLEVFFQNVCRIKIKLPNIGNEGIWDIIIWTKINHTRVGGESMSSVGFGLSSSPKILTVPITIIYVRRFLV